MPLDCTAEKPFVSVVIPHYNDLRGLKICCRQLMNQTWPRHHFEIIVADNNSDCGLDAVRAVACGARVVTAPVQGAGPARNHGVAASSGSVLAFLDSDCVPEADWLAQGVAALGNYDFVGGKVVAFSQDPERPTPVEAFERVFAFNFRHYIERQGYTGTGNMFVRRAVFDSVGGFRSEVAEDMDWSHRATSLGFRLGYAPCAVVGHPARRSWAELTRRWARMEREHYAASQERRYGQPRFVLKALIMPASIVPHAFKILFTPKLPNVRARLGALSVLARVRLWRAACMLRLSLPRITSRGADRHAALGPDQL